MGADDYDLAAAGTGVAEADDLLSADRVQVGDVIVGMRSSGVHSNGFSFIRRALFDRAHMSVDTHVADLSATVGEVLLEPTAIYTKACLALARELPQQLRVFSHITGGGIASNIARVLPTHLHADLDRGSWTPQPIFSVIQSAAGASILEMERTFNMGLGMAAITSAEVAEAAVRTLTSHGIEAWVCGEIRERADGETGDSPAKGGAGGTASLVGQFSG